MKSFIYIIFIMSVIILKAQNDTIETTGFVKNWELTHTFSLEINSFVPINNLSNYLEHSLGVGFYFGVPVSDKIRVDLGTSLFFPNTKKSISYTIDDKVLVGGAMLSGTIGFWGTYVKPLNNRWCWDTRVGTGIGFFQTDIETGKPKEENDSVYGAETIFLSLGTALRTRIFKYNIGVKFDYFLVPYNLFKKGLPTDFGMQYATIGLIYGL